MSQPYFSDELEQMRAQIARFITQEVMPQGDAWEESGEVPRAVLRQMGSLGFLGIRHEELWWLFRHCAGAYRHGLAASAPCRQ